MTEYVANKSRVLIEDYISMYNLLSGDNLVIAPSVWLDVQAPHSSVATLGSNAKVELIAEMSDPVLVSAIGNAFVGTGDRISVDVGEFAKIVSRKGYAFSLQGSGNTIVNKGTITSGEDDSGVYAGRGGISSGGMTHLSNDGIVQGGKVAAYFSAGGNEIHNSGMIDGEAYGLRIMGGSNTITNEDLINAGGTGGAAIYMTSGSGGANLINNRGGWIKAFNGGYAIQVTGLSHDTIVNAPGFHGGSSKEGWIHGDIDLGLGNDEIDNMGEIRGSINLGSGNDVITNAGKIYGDVQLGAGDDTFDGAQGLHSPDYGQKFAAIFGGDGADVIIGGAKGEVISGGAGKDYLVGNGGQDTFWFDVAPSAANSDQIGQFDVAEDRFWLSASVFGLAAGQLSAEQFRYGTKAQVISDRIVYDAATGIIAFDRDGTGSAYNAVMFAKVDPGTALKANHFFIV
jgi:Ca2+-binding RTX toxin-like protein